MFNQTRRSGLGKGLFATLFITAAGMAYIENSKQRHVVVDTDPYNRASKKEAAVDELQKAGQHIKQSAHIAGQAVHDTFDHAKQETQHAVSHVKEELFQKDARESSVKKAVGARSPESVVTGNPMVHEKHSTDRTKPGWERLMEQYAETKVHDTSTLVGKDTEKVRGVWDEKAARDKGRSSKTTTDDLYYKAKDTAHTVKKELDGGIEQVKEKAHQVYEELHKDATEKWKEQPIKSWYEKGADQVKNGLGTLKTDLAWAEQKVQDGVERVFNMRTCRYDGEKLANEELGNLRGTHIGLKPARVVVEDAKDSFF